MLGIIFNAHRLLRAPALLDTSLISLSTPFFAHVCNTKLSMELEAGLQSLRLYTETDRSLFHTCSSSFAAGHFDGHQSVLPAPNHRVFHGVAQKLVSAMFFLMEESQQMVAEMSLRDCLRAGLLRRTRVYHLKKGKMYGGLTISEWSAVLTAAPFAFGRVLRRPLIAPFGFGMYLL